MNSHRRLRSVYTRSLRGIAVQVKQDFTYGINAKQTVKNIESAHVNKDGTGDRGKGEATNGE